MPQRGVPRGPGGSRRPSRRRAPRPLPVSTPAETPARRPRLTGRAGILVLVLAVLAVSYASSMRAYLQQRAQIADLKEQISQREANIDALEREKRRWHDPAYVQAQARKRFGYLMPGETSYVVLDENGQPLESRSTLRDPAAVIKQTPKAWWDNGWESIELAGNPPEPTKQQAPASEIKAPKGQR